ncbi:hypothetical protein DRO26_03715 [Candidatus Bathyarchaeota archaeon]|nr:MAG: hypothetical protein DRO26_03715 [Candidatus Bathyarchaeota archaeon]
MWTWRRRWRGPGRPMKPRIINVKPQTIQFIPLNPDGAPKMEGSPVYMTYDEFEAYRLIFYEGLNQEEAARRMGVSRGTLWRCLENARKKIAVMLAENRSLIVTVE